MLRKCPRGKADPLSVDENKLCVPLHKSLPTVPSPSTPGYEIAFKIGDGAFSDIRAVYRKSDHKKFCIKEVNMSYFVKDFATQAHYEFNILSQLSHPNIVKIYEVFYHKKIYYMVTELLSGGELLDSICERDCYTENDARRVMQSVTEALQFCHNRNVIHRDIKPENLILVDHSPTSKVKIIDFGFARRIGTEEKLSDLRGSSMYLSPEMINGSYGFPHDVWSLGVVFYIMLSGTYPFDSPSGDVEELKEIISRGKFSFSPQRWSCISLQARDLIERMLELDTEKRITMTEVLHHPWMKNDKNKDVDISKSIAAIKKFQKDRKMRSTMLAVKATNILLGTGKNKFKQKLLDAAKAKGPELSKEVASTPSSDTVDEVLATVGKVDRNRGFTSSESTQPIEYDEEYDQ